MIFYSIINNLGKYLGFSKIGQNFPLFYLENGWTKNEKLKKKSKKKLWDIFVHSVVHILGNHGDFFKILTLLSNNLEKYFN